MTQTLAEWRTRPDCVIPPPPRRGGPLSVDFCNEILRDHPEFTAITTRLPEAEPPVIQTGQAYGDVMEALEFTGRRAQPYDRNEILRWEDAIAEYYDGLVAAARAGRVLEDIACRRTGEPYPPLEQPWPPGPPWPGIQPDEGHSEAHAEVAVAVAIEATAVLPAVTGVIPAVTDVLPAVTE